MTSFMGEVEKKQEEKGKESIFLYLRRIGAQTDSNRILGNGKACKSLCKAQLVTLKFLHLSTKKDKSRQQQTRRSRMLPPQQSKLATAEIAVFV